MSQDSLMYYDPAYGTIHPYPSLAKHYRKFHGKVAWLFNPWTGDIRDAKDVGSDVFGLLIKDPESQDFLKKVEALFDSN